jgi:hypothetical protein
MLDERIDVTCYVAWQGKYDMPCRMGGLVYLLLHIQYQDGNLPLLLPLQLSQHHFLAQFAERIVHHHLKSSMQRYAVYPVRKLQLFWIFNDQVFTSRDVSNDPLGGSATTIACEIIYNIINFEVEDSLHPM